ncbi:MAG: hypothetical protein MUF37_03870 [Methanoregulaceae archaeon]|jgi:hypothetical protein|nr:hypothetical protein [Methanoregulaceae archaeon]
MTSPQIEQIEKLKAMALKRCSDRIAEAERKRCASGEMMFNPAPHCGITSFLKRHHGL